MYASSTYFLYTFFDTIYVQKPYLCTAILSRTMRSSVATIGMFDGVHQGHLYVLSELQRYASAHGLNSLVVTFSRHPRTLLHRPMDGLITTIEERKALLESTGVDKVLLLDFEAIHTLTAEAFMRYLKDEHHVTCLLMGYDHRFGSDSLKDFASYQAAGQRAGVSVEQLPPAPQIEVSSSLIRKALQQGLIDAANRMLSRPYTLTGKVVHGKGLGHRLGFPTANLALADTGKLLPKNGVYIVRCSWHGNDYAGVMNIGNNPTVEANGQRTFVEVHLLDFSGDLYDETLRVELLHHLRDEKQFASLDELKRQITEDVSCARNA